jgi:hypothetical protein
MEQTLSSNDQGNLSSATSTQELALCVRRQVVAMCRVDAFLRTLRGKVKLRQQARECEELFHAYLRDRQTETALAEYVVALHCDEGRMLRSEEGHLRSAFTREGFEMTGKSRAVDMPAMLQLVEWDVALRMMTSTVVKRKPRQHMKRDFLLDARTALHSRARQQALRKSYLREEAPELESMWMALVLDREACSAERGSVLTDLRAVETLLRSRGTVPKLLVPEILHACGLDPHQQVLTCASVLPDIRGSYKEPAPCAQILHQICQRKGHCAWHACPSQRSLRRVRATWTQLKDMDQLCASSHVYAAELAHGVMNLSFTR